jgi:hypothetical protein
MRIGCGLLLDCCGAVLGFCWIGVDRCCIAAGLVWIGAGLLLDWCGSVLDCC